MLTSVREMRLKSGKDIRMIPDTLSLRIKGNYEWMLARISPEELVHLILEIPQPEGQPGEMAAIPYKIQNSRNSLITIINHLVNRLSFCHTASFTYSDTVYAENMLRRLGIRNPTVFIRQVQQIRQVDIQREKLQMVCREKKEMQQEWQSWLETSIKEQKIREYLEQRKEERKTYFLQESVFRRLHTAELTEKLIHIYGSSQTGRMDWQMLYLAQQSQCCQNIRLERETSWLPEQPNSLAQRNPYEFVQRQSQQEPGQLGQEGDSGQTVKHLYSQMAAAALFYLTDKFFYGKQVQYMAEHRQERYLSMTRWTEITEEACRSAAVSVERFWVYYREEGSRLDSGENTLQETYNRYQRELVCMELLEQQNLAGVIEFLQGEMTRYRRSASRQESGMENQQRQIERKIELLSRSDTHAVSEKPEQRIRNEKEAERWAGKIHRRNGKEAERWAEKIHRRNEKEAERWAEKIHRKEEKDRTEDANSKERNGEVKTKGQGSRRKRKTLRQELELEKRRQEKPVSELEKRQQENFISELEKCRQDPPFLEVENHRMEGVVQNPENSVPLDLAVQAAEKTKKTEPEKLRQDLEYLVQGKISMQQKDSHIYEIKSEALKEAPESQEWNPGELEGKEETVRKKTAGAELELLKQKHIYPTDRNLEAAYPEKESVQEKKMEEGTGLKDCLDRINKENQRRYEIWKTGKEQEEPETSRYEPDVEKTRSQALKFLFSGETEAEMVSSVLPAEGLPDSVQLENIPKKAPREIQSDHAGENKSDISEKAEMVQENIMEIYTKFQNRLLEEHTADISLAQNREQEKLGLVYRQNVPQIMQQEHEAPQKQFPKEEDKSRETKTEKQRQEQQLIRQVKESQQEVLQHGALQPQTEYLERIVEQKVQQKLHQQVNELTDKVYGKLERRLKGEKKRRGY